MSIKSDIQDIMQELFDDDLNDAMAIRGDLQTLFQELFDDDLADESVAQSMTYHSAETPVAGGYDPETGEYAWSGDPHDYGTPIAIWDFNGVTNSTASDIWQDSGKSDPAGNSETIYHIDNLATGYSAYELTQETSAYRPTHDTDCEGTGFAGMYCDGSNKWMWNIDYAFNVTAIQNKGVTGFVVFLPLSGHSERVSIIDFNHQEYQNYMAVDMDESTGTGRILTTGANQVTGSTLAFDQIHTVGFKMTPSDQHIAWTMWDTTTGDTDTDTLVALSPQYTMIGKSPWSVMYGYILYVLLYDGDDEPTDGECVLIQNGLNTYFGVT